MSSTEERRKELHERYHYVIEESKKFSSKFIECLDYIAEGRFS